MHDHRMREFFARMFREATIPYEHPGEEWTIDVKEFWVVIGLFWDLAGGYGRVTPYLLGGKNTVVLADLSIHSLKFAKERLKALNVDFVCADMRHFPFMDKTFDGVWFTQAFEYVPPDERENFLRALWNILKDDGIAFINIATVSGECSLLTYLKNFLYWKIIRREQIVWGEYIYKLKLEHYNGWHYHSLVFTRRIERKIRKTGFRIVKFKKYRKNGYPLAYLLQKEKNSTHLD